MHENTSQPAAGELLIDRTISFRNSTFGAVKAYIRRHKKRTGIELTNSAALDLLLRDQLTRVLPFAACRELRTLTPPATFFALQAVPSGDSADAPEGAPEAPQDCDGEATAPTPAGRRPRRSRASLVAADDSQRTCHD